MPFMTLGISILYAKPKKEPKALFSFMSPLSLDVWLYVATAYLCISVLLFFLGKYVNRANFPNQSYFQTMFIRQNER